MRVLELISVVLTLFLSIGCTGEKEIRGIVLVSIDTLRADHLGFHGYSRDTSPFLDSLAKRATVFETTVVQLAGTLPSHMSILTGLYPGEHGVYPPDSILPESIESLPETLHRHGFRTGGFTEGGYVSGSFGFARGFDVFSDDSEKMPDDVERTFRKAEEFIADLAPDERFFVFIHTYAVHDPYEPPLPYRSLFWQGPPPPDAVKPTGPNLMALNRTAAEVSPEVVDYYRALYDGSIRYVDDVLERFVAGLEEMGVFDEIVLIVTSDHGEEFMEHGRLLHGRVYHEHLHVPLLILTPGRRQGRRVAETSRSIDIAPTVCDLAEVPQESRPEFSGLSLITQIRNGSPAASPEAYAESFASKDRSLYRESSEGLFQLVWREPVAGADGTWVTKKVSATLDGSEVLELHSFRRDREITLRLESGEERRIQVGPEWTKIPLGWLGAGGRQVVTFETDTCESPEELGLSEDTRCLSFKIRGPRLWHSHLYHIGADPKDRIDISRDQPSLTISMEKRLQEYIWDGPRAPTKKIEDELKERLDALGYLQ